MPSDVRAQQAREAHKRASRADAQAGEYRARRNVLVRSLRQADPEQWTYTALAKAVGCSPELIAYIIKQ